MPMDTTIAAISTPPGVGAVAMIRVSGPDTFSVCDRIFKKNKSFKLALAEKNTVHYGKIVENSSGTVIDEVIAAIYRAPQSFTGEDTVEIFCHGGNVVTRRVLEEVIRAGASMAEPGEFSKRAFLNGKLDLSQAEAIIELINARSSAASSVAARQLEGKTGESIKKIRDGLLDVLSHILAYIDFPDEDVEYIDEEQVSQMIKTSLNRIESLIKTYRSGRAISEGVDCAIVGRTNAGKSSVMNRLTGDDTSIVADIEGTTRDVVSKSVTVGRVVLNLLDTAGIRDARDEIEKIGIERALSAINRAQLILFVVDITDTRGVDEELFKKVSGKPAIIVANKSDLESRCDMSSYNELGEIVYVSAKSGEGFEELRNTIESMLIDTELDVSNDDIVTQARHFEQLTRAKEALLEAINSLEMGITFDVISIDVQNAIESLGAISGQSVGDEVVDRIFERFCIGK